MRVTKTVLGAMLSSLLVSAAVAQDRGPDVRQPSSVRPTAFEYDSYLYYAPEKPSASPSDVAACPTCVPQGCESYEKGCGAGCGKNGCEPWTLPQPCVLSKHGISISGWVDQGITFNPQRDSGRYNGVVTFNDRDGEYQMNQLYMVMKRDVNTGGCGWDWGGRVDVLYGTDARFTQAIGLETQWNQTERFYQLALPQFYLDIGMNDWTLRMGHFYTILGYEVVTAPDNFFYSHAYTMQYGEPFTHTGMLLTRKWTDQISFSGGLHTGNDEFDDNVDGLNTVDFLGGVTWTSEEEALSLAFNLSTSEFGPDTNRTIYSLVAKMKLTERLDYILQHDYGWQYDSTGRADWYGLNQYWLYKINACWGAGIRAEWFRDADGTRVTGIGDGNLHTGPYVGDFYEVTAGLNWKPNKNFTLRPEVRWDWFEGQTAPGSEAPFAGNRNDQFLFGVDMIVTY